MEPKELEIFFQKAGFQGPFTATPVRAEASHRRYFRVITSDSPPQSLILCRTFPIPDIDSDDFLVLSSFLREKRIEVPRIYAVDAKEGWILQSDGGEKDLCECLYDCAGAGDSESSSLLLNRAVEELSRLHSLEPPTAVKNRRFDFDKLHWEMEFLKTHLENVHSRLGIGFRMSFETDRFIKQVCHTLGEAEPMVFTHRDYHSRNILVTGIDKRDDTEIRSDYSKVQFCLVDYQDARMGLRWYDLSSLLFDPYAPLSLKQRIQGLDYYISLTGISGNNGKSLFYLQAWQRILKALGSYLFLAFEKQMPGYFPSIRLAVDRLEEIAQLGKLPDPCYDFISKLRKESLPGIEAYKP